MQKKLPIASIFITAFILLTVVGCKSKSADGGVGDPPPHAPNLADGAMVDDRVLAGTDGGRGGGGEGQPPSDSGDVQRVAARGMSPSIDISTVSIETDRKPAGGSGDGGRGSPPESD